MNRSDVQGLLDRYYAAFSALDPDAVAAVFSENCKFVDLTLGREMNGREELRGFVGYTAKSSPSFKVVPNTILIDGDNAAVSLTMSGVDPDTGRTWSVPSNSMFKMKGGYITYKADLWNLGDVLAQVGRDQGDMPVDEP
jgi:steroid delta-isomerase-like uncharacterized protein